MKEIKFRAFIKDARYIASWRELKNQQTDLGYKRDYSIFDDNNLELMQYTGLKDKNGVEIYEGDILHIHPSGYVVVEWSDSDACFVIGEEYLYEMNFARDEVIGNVFENKELL